MSHGGDRYRNKVRLDFSVNTNPAGVPERIKNSITDSLDKLEYYPDPESFELRSAIADKFAVAADNVLLGNGASELLMAAIHAIRPAKVLLPVPSFKGYEYAARAEEADIVYWQMDEAFDVTDKLCETQDGSIDLLFLADPNNPTGRYIEHECLRTILDKCLELGIKVILDECFMELSDDPDGHTCTNELERWPNLLVLRAFTKSFAIPGVRLGYMLGSDKELMSCIKRQLPEWNISILAENAGIAALEDTGIIEEGKKIISEGRRYLAAELSRFGFDVVKSDTGYILFSCDDGPDLYEELLKREILIRDCSDYIGLPGLTGDGRKKEPRFYRIAVRPMEENKELIINLREITESYERH